MTRRRHRHRRRRNCGNHKGAIDRLGLRRYSRSDAGSMAPAAPIPKQKVRTKASPSKKERCQI